MESGKKVGVIVSVGVAAAAAGIVVVAAIARWREHRLHESKIATHLRDVQDVLTDCYNKIREIESHLPEIAETAPKERKSVRTKAIANGSPA